MITYYKIEKLMGLSSEALMWALAKNGHTDTIKETKFLGPIHGTL